MANRIFLVFYYQPLKEVIWPLRLKKLNKDNTPQKNASFD